MSKPRMCEDCRYCTEHDKEDMVGLCSPPRPWWESGVTNYVKLNSRNAMACPCFKKKGGKVK